MGAWPRAPHSGKFAFVDDVQTDMGEQRRVMRCCDCGVSHQRALNATSRCTYCGNKEKIPEFDHQGAPIIDAIDQQMYQKAQEADKPEMVEHPRHYNVLGATCHHCGGAIECIDVVERMSFNIGSAVKYVWRVDEKHDSIEDLKKAIWYLQRELENRLKKKNSDARPVE